MSKRNELQVLEKNLAVPGWRFTRSAMTVERWDEQAMIDGGLFLQTVENGRAWYWGDYINAYCEFSLARENHQEPGKTRVDPETRERCYVHYTGRYAEIAQVEVGTLKMWKCVAAFFEASTRVDALTWTHHREAMLGADGDVSVAQDWLDKAQKNNWKPSQLRAAIRLQKRGEIEPNEPLPETVRSDLVAAKRWARMEINRINDMDQLEMEGLLADLEPLIRLASELASRIQAAKSANPAPKLAGPSLAA